MDVENIFFIEDERDFNNKCVELFHFQYEEVEVYRDFCNHLRVNPLNIKSYTDIPFMPIDFFKSHRVLAREYKENTVFSSSGTTGILSSKHYVPNEELYIRSFRKTLRLFYGDYTKLAILALLPSYLERQGSSLIYMVEDMISSSSQPESGFFLHNHGELFERLNSLNDRNIPTLLIGVTFGLLDFSDTYQLNFPNLIVMETGGMKGRRKEMIRKEVHAQLKKSFGVEKVHSEYGMTELLSQAYSYGDGIFRTPPWMRILIRDTNDPLSYVENGKTGVINVIDLANRYSCSFIATQDLGKVYSDNSFEVIGRFDHADIRGCNLLIQ